ncbi:ATP-binding cassette domain-containing protein [Sphingobacterium shayense]|uniref:ATP-binding cassette domain-containing protein n=1 Tax=Sphingobacterium shayense TaxID=626343 RepID=UPI00155306B1|nr:ATP-binding cassette domain-containing protein [Sphingobacterium shayense]NQD72644.1 ATP-binding cassette domain-containing protein [Sphingobacterium shayense]
MIRLINLSKSFGTKSVLDSLDANFTAGKVYGIVGDNGAGKTTLFRCIAGLEHYKGTVDAHKNPLKNYLGYITSEPYFMSKITGEEHIYLLADARKINIENLQEQNLFNLPLKEYVSSYSTGMKKKLALTAVFLQKNDYYILDEPYNGIDLQSSMLLTAVIERLKTLGKTVLISSHIFSTLKESCDEILLLENGQFRKTVLKKDFNILEDEMKAKLMVKGIDKMLLGLEKDEKFLL